MIRIEFIYDAECPNVGPARDRLRQALISIGLRPHWQEWNLANPNNPEYVQGYGSPTILVEGEDIAGISAMGSCKSCRVYWDENGKINGVPSVSQIISAILKTKGTMTGQTNVNISRRSDWKSVFAVVPSIGTVMIPGISCPACWPAYAGLLSSLGIGFLNYTSYLLPLTIVLLTISVLALGFRARRRRGYLPACVGLIAAIVIVIGRFAVDWALLTYAGIALLVAASVWNSWLRKNKGNASCPSCVPAGNITEQR